VVRTVFGVGTLTAHHNAKKYADATAQDKVEVMQQRPAEIRTELFQQRSKFGGILNVSGEPQNSQPSICWFGTEACLVSLVADGAFLEHV